jgi:DNA-binding response OmpR family regulator
MADLKAAAQMPNDLQAHRLPILLMAEDEPLISDFIALILRDAGFEVVCVESGVEAIAELLRTPKLFAGLITDIRMGGGQSGWAVAERARELIPDVAVVYVSAHGEGEWAALGVPDSVMVPKPFAPEQIVTAISALLKRRSADG